MTDQTSTSKENESADSRHGDSPGTGIHPDSGKGPHSLATAAAGEPVAETATGAPAMALASGKGPHS